MYLCLCDVPAGGAVRQPVLAVQGREFRRRAVRGCGSPLRDDRAQGWGAAGVGTGAAHRGSSHHHRLGHEAEAQKGEQTAAHGISNRPITLTNDRRMRLFSVVY